MRTLAAQGLGVIFTTHDPNHAIRYADRAMLMHLGSIVADGPVADTLIEGALKDLYGTPVTSFRSATASHHVFLAE